jgi:hypothetical protein
LHAIFLGHVHVTACPGHTPVRTAPVWYLDVVGGVKGTTGRQNCAMPILAMGPVPLSRTCHYNQQTLLLSESEEMPNQTQSWSSTDPHDISSHPCLGKPAPALKSNANLDHTPGAKEAGRSYLATAPLLQASSISPCLRRRQCRHPQALCHSGASTCGHLM